MMPQGGEGCADPGDSDSYGMGHNHNWMSESHTFPISPRVHAHCCQNSPD